MDNILIIGVGSVGTLMGLSLIKAGLKVTFAGRPRSKYTKLIKEQGLKITYSTGESFWLSPLHPRVRFIDTETNLLLKFDLIIVALKSNDLLEASSYIQSHSTQNTVIVHAQNGIPYWWFDDDVYLQSFDSNVLKELGDRRHLESVDPQGAILRTIGDRQIVGCVVKAPCQNLDGCIKVRKPPKLIMGETRSNCDASTQKRVQTLCQIFSNHGLSASYTHNIRASVCNKLAVNATTNVLSALTGKVIGDLTANSHTNNLIKTILAQINQIFQLYGIGLADLPTESQVYSYIQAPGSQSHLPSLAQDFSQHRLGEISLITAPVEMAKIANFAVPTLSSLAELLQLGQTYTLNGNKGKSHILTFDKLTGYCVLTNDVCQNYLFEKLHISEILTHLAQVNVSAFRTLSYS